MNWIAKMIVDNRGGDKYPKKPLKSNGYPSKILKVLKYLIKKFPYICKTVIKPREA